jgi:hypothetical protein
VQINAETTPPELAEEIAAATGELSVYRDRPDSIAFRSEADALERAYTAQEQRQELAPAGRPAVALTLLHAVAYDRPTSDGFKPIPDGYSLDHLTIVRADQVRAGDLVVGDVDQPLKRGSRLRWATWRAAPFVAQPGPDLADCPNCRAWMSGYEGPSVTLFPHCPEAAGELIAIVPPVGPVTPAPAACVNACHCTNGRIRLKPDAYSPWPHCGDCHGRPCDACREAGSSTH